MKSEKQDLQILEIQNEEGASMLEYALMAALIAVVCIVAVTFIGQEASETFHQVGSVLNQANDSSTP